MSTHSEERHDRGSVSGCATHPEGRHDRGVCQDMLHIQKDAMTEVSVSKRGGPATASILFTPRYQTHHRHSKMRTVGKF